MIDPDVYLLLLVRNGNMQHSLVAKTFMAISSMKIKAIIYSQKKDI